MKTKICSKCKKEKPFSEFYRQNDRKSGYRSACKECCDKQRKGNLDKYRKYAR